MPVDKWDRRFMELAEFISDWSVDSTKVGAVIVDDKRRIISVGYNGFARGVVDNPDRYQCREMKYQCTVHAEVNAVLFAKTDLTGTTLYTTPFMSCSRCAAVMIQAGIKRCVAPPLPDHLKERWQADIELAQQQFAEAGVQLDIINIKGE